VRGEKEVSKKDRLRCLCVCVCVYLCIYIHVEPSILYILETFYFQYTWRHWHQQQQHITSFLMYCQTMSLTIISLSSSLIHTHIFTSILKINKYFAKEVGNCDTQLPNGGTLRKNTC
jgi:hypothetical protein